ncbi:hypothetical protein HYV88_04605 [Candidatus Woesearchaeota archaeon]|nr:hypothetical protein [Candidatus Woesearchaeota archaeon]
MRLLYKKGRLEWETLGGWLIWLAIAIIALLLIIAIKNASEDKVSIFEGLRNFGGLIK